MEQGGIPCRCLLPIVFRPSLLFRVRFISRDGVRRRVTSFRGKSWMESLESLKTVRGRNVSDRFDSREPVSIAWIRLRAIMLSYQRLHGARRIFHRQFPLRHQFPYQ